MSTKKKILTAVLGVEVILIAAFAAFLFYLNSDTVKITRQLELAQRYLLEEDYEQAIAAFEAVIETDPKNVDAYLGLAQAYAETDELEKAVKILEKGYRRTDAEELSEQIDAWEAELAQAEESTQTETQQPVAEAEPLTDIGTASREESAAETEPATDDSMAQAEKAYMEAYKAKLREIKDGDAAVKESRFALVYVDNDDIPELVVVDGNYHAAAGELYTYHDNQVTRLGEYGSWGTFGYIPKTGFIYSDYMGMGFYAATVHQLSDGKVMELFNISRDENPAYEPGGEMDPDKMLYYIGDNEVTRAEYEAKEKELTSLYRVEDEETVSYENMAPITEANLAKYIK